jgi:hypothetical protein
MQATADVMGPPDKERVDREIESRGNSDRTDTEVGNLAV